MTDHRGLQQKDPGNAKAAPPGRIVVKAGTNLLTGGTNRLDLDYMAFLVAQIARLRDRGTEVLLVTSGAVAAGREVLEEAGRGVRDGARTLPKSKSTPWSWELPFRQVLASLGQGHLMYLYEQLFAQHGLLVAQALLTRRDIADRVGYLNIRNTLQNLLGLGAVPVLNENDVVEVEELRGEVIGDNDTLSALVANMVDADLLVLLGDVAGLYTADPHRHPGARLIPRVERLDELEAEAGVSGSGLGRGGMVTKLEAARLAMTSGITTIVAHGREPDILSRLTAGEPLGTWFLPTATRRESRQRWMLSAISPSGALVVDAGAVRALRGQNRSLLPAGVQEVRGDFQRGEVVPILGPDGERVAAGIVNYSAVEARRILGMRSDRIKSILGDDYGAELVHRNNMVVL